MPALSREVRRGLLTWMMLALIQRTVGVKKLMECPKDFGS